MPERAKDIIRRADRMLSQRSNWESSWEMLRSFINPDGESFVDMEAPGVRRRFQVLDNTAEMAWELLSATLHGMATNPSLDWFEVKARRERLNRVRNVKLYLEEATRRMRIVVTGSGGRFRQVASHMYDAATLFGTAAAYTQSRPGRLPLFKAIPLRETLIGMNADDEIDVFYRPFTLTARQAADQWGRDVGPKTWEMAGNENRMDTPIEFIHAVQPRPDTDPRAFGARAKPFASIEINKSEQVIVREGGYDEMPFHVWRWKRSAGEVYGRGRGHVALGDTKGLQRVNKSWIRAGEQAIRPPMQRADDGIMRPVNLSDGAVNTVRADLLARGGSAIQPINTGARVDIAADMMELVHRRIDNAFFRGLLTIAQDPRMTATQFLEGLDERLRIFSPFLGNLETDWLTPMLDRTFSIMQRQGLLPPPPEELEDGEEVVIEYKSPLKQAQKLVEARGVARTIEVMSPLAALDPTILDNQHGDRSYRRVAELLGQAPELLRSEEERDELRQARAEATAREQTKVDLLNAANAAGQAAPALQAVAGGGAGA